MAIQNRRGSHEKLDTTKLLPGEHAVVLQNDPFCKDGKAVYICFRAGDTKRMATYEDMVENIENATDEVGEAFTEDVRAATKEALDKAVYAKLQGDYAKSQGDYAKSQGDYAGDETNRIHIEFDTIKGIILETESGELLLQVKQLLEDLYRIATETDINNIINGTYVDEDNEGSIFDTGSNEDIDEIIMGTFVDKPDEDIIEDSDIKAIIDQLT